MVWKSNQRRSSVEKHFILFPAFLPESHKFSFLQIFALTAWALTQMVSTVLYIIGLEKVWKTFRNVH